MPEARKRYAEAVDALNRNDWSRAQKISMHLIRDVPPHAGVYFVAGVAARELLQIPLALECLQRAVQLNPERADYLAQLARALAQASEPGRALEVADRAVALAPADAMTLDTLGVVYSQVHADAKAADMFRQVVELQPAQPRYRFNFATSLIHAGDVEGAENELQACLEGDPRTWKAYLSRALLRKQTPESNHIAQMQAVLADVGSDVTGQLCVNMALSKELEDLGEYAAAFAHLSTGKAAVRETRDYTSARDAELFAAIEAASPGTLPVAAGYPSNEPIFIIGMPRTGTTLIERILSSHPDVQAVGELQNFGVSLKRATGSRTPSMLDVDTMQRARNLDWASLGKQYIDSTRPITGGSPRFIDKLPHNFLYAGFIAAALPNARLICLRRNAMDTCLSNFRQLFALTSPYYDYSFDLLDTGRYYLLFDRLMAFWRATLPGRVLEIDYEAVVEQPEVATRQLLEFTGLPWNDACLRFHENEAPVATASALQVRAPINSASIDRWRRYEPQLGELRSLLVKAGVPVPG
jgi:Tfp pilus assembly protein PilF